MKKIIALLLGVLASPVFADSVYEPGKYYIAPGVAYYHFSDKRDLQNAAMVDVTAGYVVNQHFSLEALYGQAITEPTPTSVGEEETRFYAYWLDGVYHFQPDAQENFYPYVLGGIGVTNQHNNSIESGNTTFAGVNVGAGLEYFVNSQISFFADVRDVYTMSGGQNDWLLNAGIKFMFGDATPAPITTPVASTTTTSGTSGFYELQESTQ